MWHKKRKLVKLITNNTVQKNTAYDDDDDFKAHSVFYVTLHFNKNVLNVL